MSTTTTGHNYGVGLLAILVASGAGILYYQMYYVPEMFATPDVDEHILHPVKSTTIEMIMGSANADQQDNFVPKLVQIQLRGTSNIMTRYRFIGSITSLSTRGIVESGGM